jgi:hypothetical protein
MNIINLTPHAILLKKNNSFLEIKPSGIVCRISQEMIKVNEIDGIYIYKSVFGKIQDLPEKKENTIYIVSSMVKHRINFTDYRKDVFSPAKLIRTESGEIIGCEGLEG